jgi:hypothetical protein
MLAYERLEITKDDVGPHPVDYGAVEATTAKPAHRRMHYHRIRVAVVAGLALFALVKALVGTRGSPVLGGAPPERLGVICSGFSLTAAAAATVTPDDRPPRCTLERGNYSVTNPERGAGSALGSYDGRPAVTTGWFELQVEAFVDKEGSADSLLAAAYAAGLAEGVLGCKEIHQWAFNRYS